jgi:hypothetical protein
LAYRPAKLQGVSEVNFLQCKTHQQRKGEPMHQRQNLIIPSPPNLRVLCVFVVKFSYVLFS